MPNPQTPPANKAQTAKPNTPSNKPVDKFREGRVHVSIWENDGVHGAFRTASFEIRFKKSNAWQSGASYALDDLAYLELAAKQARTRIEQWKREIAGRAATPDPKR
jgi:hypothetical protein